MERRTVAVMEIGGWRRARALRAQDPARCETRYATGRADRGDQAYSQERVERTAEKRGPRGLSSSRLIRLQAEQGQGGAGSSLMTLPRTRLQEPSLYQIFLHNDDYTPMDFVVQILEEVFHMDRVSANKVMLNVHEKGLGSCGLYPYEIAETKVALVTESARKYEYPLKCTMEKDT